jgi:hypothetical protein
VDAPWAIVEVFLGATVARRRFGKRRPSDEPDGPSLHLQASIVTVAILLGVLFWAADALDAPREIGTQLPAFIAILTGTAVIGWFMRNEAERPPDERH